MMDNRRLRDVNSIVTLYEMFVYQEDGEAPYTNPQQMMAALRLITDAVIIMENETIDAHKTK
jgi:hypothetical protein